MAKKFMLLLVVVMAYALIGCKSHGGYGLWHRGWKHMEWHLLGAYKDLVQIHKGIDRYIFNLDERNPDRY